MTEKRKIGIIGGGQLGLMLIKHGLRLIDWSFYSRASNHMIRVIDPNAHCSCASLADELVVGDLYDEQKLLQFAEGLDVITYEIEHISIPALKKIAEKQPNTEFIPSIETLEIVQNKISQKRFFETNGIPTVRFQISTDDTIVPFQKDNDNRMIWKSDTGGYDGKGVQLVYSGTKVPGPGVLEQLIHHPREYSVNVVVQDGRAFCDEDGNILDFTVTSFLPTKMVVNHELNMLDYCMCSCELDYETRCKLKEIAEKTALSFKSKGLFAVEMFLTNDGEIFVNEVAPRPHNSSHYTIDIFPDNNAYTALAYMLTGLHFSIREYQGNVYGEDYGDFVSDEMHTHYVMKNILGPEYMTQSGTKYGLLELHDDENVSVISYQKSETRPNRKIGHLTYTTEYPEFHDIYGGVSLNTLITKLMNSVLVVPEGGVAVVMGSTSDWSVMKQACEVLDELEVPYAKSVVSAHRTPDRLCLFGKRARDAGLKCIIAGAGGAAHLPGMLAAYTELPVIGVPVKSETSALSGVDALHSIVQMPPGVPVAAVAINGAQNAGILGAQIAGYIDQVREYKDSMEQSVLLKVNELK